MESDVWQQLPTKHIFDQVKLMFLEEQFNQKDI